MTRGHKSSERKACYHAFFASLAIAMYAIYAGVDLSEAGVLIGAVNLPLMWFAGMRTTNKWKNGESDT